MPLPDWLKSQNDDDQGPLPTPPAGNGGEPGREPVREQPPAPTGEPEGLTEIPTTSATPPEPAVPPGPPDTVPPEPAPDATVVQAAMSAAEQAVGAVEQAANPPQGGPVVQMLELMQEQLQHLSEMQREQAERLAALDRSPPSPPSEQPTLAELEDREQQLHAMRCRVEELERQLADSVQQLDDTEVINEQLRDAETEVAKLREEAAEALDQARLSDRRLEDAAREIEQLKGRLDRSDGPVPEGDAGQEAALRHEEQLEQLQAALAERDATIRDLRRRIDEAGASSPSVESGESAGAPSELLERQRRQIERLTEQLAELQGLEAEPREIRVRDDRIAELERQVEELAAGSGVGKLVAGVGEALRRGARGREEEDAEAAATQALQTRLKELEARNAKLREAFAAAQAEADAMRESAADASAESAPPAADVALQARVQELEQQLEQQARAVPAGADPDEIARLTRRVRELESQQHQPSPARMAPVHPITSPPGRDPARPPARAAALAAPTPRASTAGLRRPAAILLLVLVSAAASAVGGLVAANTVVPPRVAAGVQLEARDRAGGQVLPIDAESWQAWHAQRLGDPEFLQGVAARLGDQQLDDWSQAEALSARLASTIAIDVRAPGVVRLTLEGTERRELPLVLDAIATSLAREWSRSVGPQHGDAAATLAGRRDEAGRERYARLQPDPIADHRPVVGTAIAGVLFVIGLVVLRRAYRSLAEARGLADDVLLESRVPF